MNLKFLYYLNEILYNIFRIINYELYYKFLFMINIERNSLLIVLLNEKIVIYISLIFLKL